MQKGGLERRRAFPLIGVEILGRRPRRGLLMSDRALGSSHSTRSSYASFRGRHSSVPRRPKPAQTSVSIGENVGWWSWAVRRWVRMGWSKKILRVCGATAVHCGVAYYGFTALESKVESSVMSKPMSPIICVSD